MRHTLVFAAALLASLAACGQKDNVTSHTQPAAPGTAPEPKPLAGEPKAPPGGGRAVYPGSAPVTPGGAVAPGQGASPDAAAPADKPQR